MDEEEGDVQQPCRTPILMFLVWGDGLVVAATDHPPLEVGGQPAHCVVSERGVCE